MIVAASLSSPWCEASSSVMQFSDVNGAEFWLSSITGTAVFRDVKGTSQDVPVWDVEGGW